MYAGCSSHCWCGGDDVLRASHTRVVPLQIQPRCSSPSKPVLQAQATITRYSQRESELLLARILGACESGIPASVLGGTGGWHVKAVSLRASAGCSRRGALP